MTTDSEIKAVVHVLTLDHEGKSVEDVAAECIKALRTLEGTAVRQSMGPLVIGEVFRTPVFKNPLIVAWQNSSYTWLVTKDDTYGWITSDPFKNWHYREPARITDAVRTKALTNVDGHQAGDMFIDTHGDTHIVACTCKGGVLFFSERYSAPFAESNDSLKRFYKKVG